MEVLLLFSTHKSMSQGANQRVFDPGDPLCRPQDDPHITWPIKVVHLRPHATSDSIKGALNFSEPKGSVQVKLTILKAEAAAILMCFIIN